MLDSLLKIVQRQGLDGKLCGPLRKKENNRYGAGAGARTGGQLNLLARSQ